MTETISTVVVTLSSVFLFAYWFRYVCLLILAAKAPRDEADRVAAVNGLRFRYVQTRLRERVPSGWLELQKALDRDYRFLVYLLDHGNPLHADRALEKRLLQVNYRVMRARCSVSRRFFISPPRRALEEMASVVAHFAGMFAELRI